MNVTHTKTPWVNHDGAIFGADGFFIADVYTEHDEHEKQQRANAAFIVRACNSHASWAKWIVQRGPDLPDHACAECVPGGELVKAGFQCIYHEALAAAEAA